MEIMAYQVFGNRFLSCTDRKGGRNLKMGIRSIMLNFDDMGIYLHSKPYEPIPIPCKKDMK